MPKHNSLEPQRTPLDVGELFVYGLLMATAALLVVALLAAPR